MCEGLTDKLSQTLGCTHGIGGANRFIGGYHHKGFNIGRHCRLGQIQCAKDVITHSLHEIKFHHRHMLVSSSVVDSMHLETFEHCLKTARMLH